MALMMTQVAVAQLPSVVDSVPKIAFNEWREVQIGDVSKEYEVLFPSAVSTEYPENQTVRVSAFLPADRVDPVPAVLILHYWGAFDLSAERRMAANLNRHGIAAVLMTMPYHLSRTPRGFASGALAIQPDPALLVRTMTQSVFDVRRTIDWIQTRPEFKRDQIGISGMSLGAIVAALVSGIDTRISAQCYMIGGVDLAHILWNSSRVVQVREALRKKGYTEASLREEIKTIEPEPLLAASPRRPALVIAARYDTIVPNGSTEKLIHALGNPIVEWLATGHIGGVFAASPILRSQSDFFASAFANRPYRTSSSLRAPTLRFGTIGSSSGVEVFGGQVLVKTKSGFSVSVLISPRKIHLYPALEIDRSLGIGVSISGRRVSPAFSWSFVL